MYTFQSLWTMAREELDITAVIFNNRSYAILNIELERVGAEGDGPRAKSQLDLAGPNLDFVSLAKGLGVPATSVDTCESFAEALRRAIAEPGPHLIEALVPSAFSGFRLKAMPVALNALGKMPRPMAQAIKKRIAP
jgi:acetolactate synthase-1/2/3 large subunit